MNLNNKPPCLRLSGLLFVSCRWWPSHLGSKKVLNVRNLPRKWGLLPSKTSRCTRKLEFGRRSFRFEMCVFFQMTCYIVISCFFEGGWGRRRQEFSKLNFASFWSFFDGCFHLVFLGSLAWSSAIVLWTFLFHPLNTSDQSVDIPPENVSMSLVTRKKEFFFFSKG